MSKFQKDPVLSCGVCGVDTHAVAEALGLPTTPGLSDGHFMVASCGHVMCAACVESHGHLGCVECSSGPTGFHPIPQRSDHGIPDHLKPAMQSAIRSSQFQAHHDRITVAKMQEKIEFMKVQLNLHEARGRQMKAALCDLEEQVQKIEVNFEQREERDRRHQPPTEQARFCTPSTHDFSRPEVKKTSFEKSRFCAPSTHNLTRPEMKKTSSEESRFYASSTHESTRPEMKKTSCEESRIRAPSTHEFASARLETKNTSVMTSRGNEAGDGRRTMFGGALAKSGRSNMSTKGSSSFSQQPATGFTMAKVVQHQSWKPVGLNLDGSVRTSVKRMSSDSETGVRQIQLVSSYTSALDANCFARRPSQSTDAKVSNVGLFGQQVVRSGYFAT